MSTLQATNLKHASSASNNIVLDASGNAAIAGNLSFNSGFGSAGVAYGCRAWVNFNGTGTVAIRGSANVSSITDNGTGDFRVNFITAMPDANYAAHAVGDHVPGVYESRASIRNGSVATGSVRFDFHNGGNSPVDVTTACVAIFR